MFHSRMISAAIAGGLVLGSTGMALAHTPSSTPNGYRQFIAGATRSVITAPGSQMAMSTNNSFALYRRSREPSNAGTPIVAAHIAGDHNDTNSRVNPDTMSDR